MVETQNGTAIKEDVIEEQTIKLSLVETVAWRGFLAQVELANIRLQAEEMRLYNLIESEHNLPEGCLADGSLYVLDRTNEQWVLKKK